MTYHRSNHNSFVISLYQTVKPHLRGIWIGGVLVALLMGFNIPTKALELSDLDGSNGFVINNIQGHVFDALGVSVSDAGDINNDGISDVIIGDPLADPTGYNNSL